MVKWIGTMFSNLLRLDLLGITLSTFLGFLSALFVEEIIDKRNECKLRKQLISNLVEELSSVNDTLLELNPKEVYMKPYRLPIWKGACDGGSIIYLDKLACFSKIIEVFSTIDEANIIELYCFELYLGNSTNQDMSLILNELQKNRKHVQEQVSKGLTLLREEVR